MNQFILVSLFPLHEYICKLLDDSCKWTKTVAFFIRSWKISHHTGIISFGQEEHLQLQFLNKKKSRIWTQMNWFICFHWAIGYVNYCIIPAMRQNTLIPLLILVSINNIKWLRSCGLQQDLLALSIWSIQKCRMLSQKNKLNLFHWLVTWVNYWIVSGTTQNTFIALINRGVNK